MACPRNANRKIFLQCGQVGWCSENFGIDPPKQWLQFRGNWFTVYWLIYSRPSLVKPRHLMSLSAELYLSDGSWRNIPITLFDPGGCQPILGERYGLVSPAN
jgi:hypothetical protein